MDFCQVAKMQSLLHHPCLLKRHAMLPLLLPDVQNYRSCSGHPLNAELLSVHLHVFRALELDVNLCHVLLTSAESLVMLEEKEKKKQDENEEKEK